MTNLPHDGYRHPHDRATPTTDQPELPVRLRVAIAELIDAAVAYELARRARLVSERAA